MNYKLTVAYDGTLFHGWAIQKDQRTVYGELLKALCIVFNTTDLKLNASGRTDSWVHANNQIINFKSSIVLNTVVLKRSLNKLISNDIYIKKISCVSNDFHARYDVVKKQYYYLINCNNYDVFNRNYMYQYNKSLNIKLLKECAKLFIGKHNFLSFSVSTLKDNERNIYKIKVQKLNNKIIKIIVEGNGFLRYMVRMLVGAMINYSNKKISKDQILFLLKNPKKGSSIYKVPGCGLYMNKVFYK